MGSQADLMGGRFLCCFWADFAVSEAVSEIYCIPKCLICILFLIAGLLVHSVRCLHLLPPGAMVIGTVWGGSPLQEMGFPLLYFGRIFSILGDPAGRRHFAVLGGELILCRGAGNPRSTPAAPRDPVPLCRNPLALKEGEKPLHSFFLS